MFSHPAFWSTWNIWYFCNDRSSLIGLWQLRGRNAAFPSPGISQPCHGGSWAELKALIRDFKAFFRTFKPLLWKREVKKELIRIENLPVPCVLGEAMPCSGICSNLNNKCRALEKQALEYWEIIGVIGPSLPEQQELHDPGHCLWGSRKESIVLDSFFFIE